MLNFEPAWGPKLRARRSRFEQFRILALSESFITSHDIEHTPHDFEHTSHDIEHTSHDIQHTPHDIENTSHDIQHSLQYIKHTLQYIQHKGFGQSYITKFRLCNNTYMH